MTAIPGEIVEAVKERKCILFLGAMASAPTPPGCRYEYSNAPPNGGELSKQLAEMSGYTDEADPKNSNLQRVSLHFQYREGGSRAGLVTEIKRRVAADGIVPSPALHMLAALPFPIIITTNYDHLFDQALRQARTVSDDAFKDPIVMVYDPDLKREPTFVTPEPTEKKPVLVKLHGDIDRPESIVITEEDYLVFIQKMSDKHHHPLHENLLFRINNWHVLFVGYSLKDYNLRLLFRTLRWHVDPANIPLSFSVDPKPDNLIVSVWQSRDKPMVSFVREDLWSFVPALYEACLGHQYQPRPAPAS
jgi:SIR2-like protein